MFLKDGLPKNVTLEYDLSYNMRKMAFLFPENLIFFYGGKMKDDIAQKIHRNMLFSVHW